MSKNQKQNTDRRSLLGAAAAAGAAVPFLGGLAQAAMSEADAPKAGQKFVVDLGGVKLPEDIATKLADEIRQAALRAVAAAGLKLKDVSPPRIIHGTLDGLWMIPENRHL